ncbi:MAG: protease inhibitor I9 family protein [Solirubrobacteraceae bacterium]
MRTAGAGPSCCFAGKLDSSEVAELRDDPRVAAVTRDSPMQATGLVPVAGADSVPTGIRRTGAAVHPSARETSSANVAVIDTGTAISWTSMAWPAKASVRHGPGAQRSSAVAQATTDDRSAARDPERCRGRSMTCSADGSRGSNLLPSDADFFPRDL